MSAKEYFSRARRLIGAMYRTSGTRTNAVLQTVWEHHAGVSGYHPVSRGLGVEILTGHRLFPAFVGRRIAQGFRVPTGEMSVQLASCMALCGRRTLLVIDGDNTFSFINDLLAIRQTAVVPVMHLPPEELAERLQTCPDGFYAGVVCVARCQLPIAKRVAASGLARFIPHGVDCQYFCPGGRRSDSPLFVCCGVHRRDFELLNAVGRRLKTQLPDAEIRLIAPRKFMPVGVDLSAINVRFDVTDEELRETYRAAWALVMPLTDATANNSILEAMACGTPVIASQVGGVPDYADDSCGMLCSNEPTAFSEAILSIGRFPDVRDVLGAAARVRALTFDWSEIVPQVRNFLDEVRMACRKGKTA